MKSLEGMVLLIVLLFLLMITVLGLGSLQMAWIETKMSHAIWEKHLLKREANRVLKMIEEQVLTRIPPCIIPVDSTEKLLARSLTWWQTSVSCKSDSQDFHSYYVVEFLGDDPCAIVQFFPRVSAQYYRITEQVTHNNAKMILQSTVIKPHRTDSVCAQVEHAATPGRQMWREMDVG